MSSGRPRKYALLQAAESFMSLPQTPAQSTSATSLVSSSGAMPITLSRSCMLSMLSKCLEWMKQSHAPAEQHHALQMIARLGKEIDNEDSIYYWAWKNAIPVFSPALTDGSIGDMLFFHTYRNPGFVLDIVADIRAMNDEAIKASPRKTGMIILGGGEARLLQILLPRLQWRQNPMSGFHCWKKEEEAMRPSTNLSLDLTTQMS